MSFGRSVVALVLELIVVVVVIEPGTPAIVAVVPTRTLPLATRTPAIPPVPIVVAIPATAGTALPGIPLNDPNLRAGFAPIGLCLVLCGAPGTERSDLAALADTLIAE